MKITDIIVGGFILVIILGASIAVIIGGLVVKMKQKGLKKNHPEILELMHRYWDKKNKHSRFYWDNVYKVKEDIDNKVHEQKYLTKKDIVESNKEIEKLREKLKQNKEESDRLYSEVETLHTQLVVRIEELPKYKKLIYNYYGIKRDDT